MKTVSVAMKDDQFDLIQRHAESLGMTVEELVMDQLYDVMALESNDPYLSVVKRRAQTMDKMLLRTGRLKPEDVALIPRSLAKNAIVEFPDVEDFD